MWSAIEKLFPLFGSAEKRADTFNRDVFPEAMARAGIPTDGPLPEPFEFTPAAVMTPRAVAYDALT